MGLRRGEPARVRLRAPADGSLILTRRQLLGATAAAGAVLILPKFGNRALAFTLIPGFSTWARRPDDLVSLKLDFYNLILDNTDPLRPRLVRKPNTTDSFVIATFWPQNVAEETFDEPDPPPAPPPAPIRSILANASRLAFSVPSSVSSIPLDLESVLQWSSWAQKVTPVARTNGPRDTSALTEPDFLDTAIEVPFRLILSPSEQSHWTNATKPVNHAGWTELWHTRMDEAHPERRLLRAVWDRDLSFPTYAGGGAMNPGDAPFSTMDLDPIDRADIVLNTSIDVPGVIGQGRGFTSSPVKSDRLMLSALGAWIDSDGIWEGAFKPHGNDLLEWRQRGTLGRDHYVKIVREGYLFPFGHPAVLIKISERKFNFNTGGQLGAYLRTRFFLVVRKPLKDYSSQAAGPLAPGQQHQGRAFPFRSVRFTTLVTPDLDSPTASQYVALDPMDSGEKTFVARVAGKPFLFHAVATDWGGLTQEFAAGVVFVPGAVAFQSLQTTVNNVVTTWNTTPEAGLQDRAFDGQRVNFAEIAPKADTSLPANVLTFAAEGPLGGTSLTTLKAADQSPFYPTVSDAEVRLAAAEQVKAGQLGAPHIKIAQVYIDHGFQKPDNNGQIYAEIVSSPVGLRFGADKSGGVMTPNLSITGLSRGLGPVGDTGTIASGNFDPAAFFAGSDPKILGGLELVKILATALFGIDSDGKAEDHAPAMTTKELFKDGLVGPDDAPPEGIHTTYHWKPKLKADPLNIFVPDTGNADADQNGKASLDVDITTDLKAPDNSTFSIKGELDNFTVNLFGTDFRVLIIHFNSFKFTVDKGTGMNADPQIDKVEFDGVLKFIEELKKYLPSTGDGPSVDVKPDGIKVAYSLAIPSITSGQFNLFDLKLGASMTMPFTDKPVRFRFEFCTRENPFKLTIYIFGGGGFFALGVGTDGFEILEVALEFGVAASIDLGIASGSAKIVVGVYFKLEEKAGPPKHQETSLTGYFRAHGEVSVMGIISITLDIYLGLSYEFDNNKVTGTATVSISVHIIFFSISASVTVERKFGGEGDPKFVDAIPDQNTWNEYADAFASLAA